MQCAHIMGISFAKLRLFFHKVSFITKTLFLPLHETLYSGHVILFASASQLSHMQCFCSSSSAKQRPQTASCSMPKKLKLHSAKLGL
jgi:hypothetical protein